MNANLQFDFIVDKAQNTLTITREFAAPRARVWDCYTQPELLDQWFAPKPLTAKTQLMDFREGGRWHYVMIDPSGQEYWSVLQYLTITPQAQYTALDGFSNAAGELNPDMPQARWEVNFSDKSDHALVQSIVQYASLADLETVVQMGMEAGMASVLERLDELLVRL